MPKCKHEFEPCTTPPDSGFKWYRCDLCAVFAYKRGKNFVPYRCTISKCKGQACTRLPGRGQRMSYIWRCAEHPETTCPR